MVGIAPGPPADRADAGVFQIDIAPHADFFVHTVENHPVGNIQGKRGRLRFIRVQHEGGVRNQLNPFPDLLQRVFDAPETVHLVAEKIRDDNRFGMDQGNHLFQGRLVAFYDRVVRLRFPGPACVAGQVRGDAGQKVCP